MGFVIYDLETSGLHKRFDQILQFAAIHTDDELEPVDPPLHIRARLSPSTLPSAAALLVTGRSIEEITDPKLPSLHSVVQEVHAAFVRWTPAMILGFNSIKFDEELLRQAFYQNLQHPIYVTNIKNNRGDVLRLARAVALLAPEAMTIPNLNGHRSFRLTDIAQANGLRIEHGHDALSDAQTTLELCRMIRDRAPDAWSSFSRFAHKANVIEFIREEEAFALLGERAESDFACVTLVASHPTDTNLHYCLDLTADIPALQEMSVEELCFAIGHKGGPVRALRANASPAMAQLWELESQNLLPIPAQDIERLANSVRADEEFLDRLAAAIQSNQPVWPVSEHVEEQIYDRFIPNGDSDLFSVFHQTDWSERLSFIAKFSDPRVKRLAQRLILQEAPHVLDPKRRSALAHEVEKRLDGSIADAPWTTAPKLMAEIEALSAGCTEKVRRILDGLSIYLSTRFP